MDASTPKYPIKSLLICQLNIKSVGHIWMSTRNIVGTFLEYNCLGIGRIIGMLFKSLIVTVSSTCSRKLKYEFDMGVFVHFHALKGCC